MQASVVLIVQRADERQRLGQREPRERLKAKKLGQRLRVCVVENRRLQEREDSNAVVDLIVASHESAHDNVRGDLPGR